MGPSPKAPFDIEPSLAHTMLAEPSNVNGRPNSDVIRPVASAVDLVRRSRGKWTIDFGTHAIDSRRLSMRCLSSMSSSTYIRCDCRADETIFVGNGGNHARPRLEMREALIG